MPSWIDLAVLVADNWQVKIRIQSTVRLFLGALIAIMMAGCLPAAAPADIVVTREPTGTRQVAVETSPSVAALLTVMATPSATAEPPTRTPQATAAIAPLIPPPTVSIPTPTPVDPAAGLPCPDENPAKPDYARGGVGTAPWPTADPARSTPHLWFGNPVNIEGLPRINRNFPYGADSNGRYLLHNGLDVVEPPGTPVLAVAEGTVIVAGPDADRQFGWRCDWYGHLVVLELDQTWDGQPVYVLYGHVLEVAVEAGERVRQGDPLAVIGVGGVATAPHLHVEVRVGLNEFGATRNPTLWLSPASGYGTIAGRLLDPDGRPWQGMQVTLINLSGGSDFVYTWTYLDDPQHLINPDEALGENFAFGYVPVGEYDIYVQVQDREYRERVSVTSDRIATVDIVTDLFLTPTPGPLPSATP